MKSTKFIVTTTIQPPTPATLKFSSMEGWTLVVVGDLDTPHDEYREIDCVYLSPEDQENLAPELSAAIGWRCIQRRNLGFLYAYQNGATVIATVDDDNIPYPQWGENLYVGTTIEVDLWESANGVFDPLSVTEPSDLWHRGYPIEKVPTKNNVSYLGKHSRRVLVQADLWDGDPDVDAVCRATRDPSVKYEVTEPFASSQISPFNSQNTFLAREVVPYYMVLPFVGRMDDIWGGFALFNIFTDFLIYNSSTVFQQRNEHSLIADMEGEMIGYRHTQQLLDGEFELPPKAATAYNAYRDWFTRAQ